MPSLKRAAALLLSVSLLAACSREGFEQSLGRRDGDNSSSSQSSSSSSTDSTANDAFIFDLDIIEKNEGNLYLYYTMPEATESDAEVPAKKISETVESAILTLQDEFAIGEDGSLEVYDGIGRNDGTYFSLFYEISYSADSESEPQKRMFGMVFDAHTGDILGVESFVDADILTTLLLDEQSSKIKGKDEELQKLKREYLEGEGKNSLKKRLCYPDGEVSMDRLLDASFYLDGSKLAAIFASSDDIGGFVEISVAL